jgi:lipoprotein-anchoring transpeptidase ErfK/SrfK
MFRVRRRVIAGVVAASVVLAACGGSDGDDAAEKGGEGATTSEPAPTSSPPEATSPAAGGVSLVAQATGAEVPVFTAPDQAEPSQTLPSPNENGAPLVFLVKEQQDAWINVHLPVRPNGSTGWIRAADVTVVSNPYRVDIQLAAHRLTVTKGDEVVLDEAIAVGTSETPTPGGVYYIKELLQPPDPNGAYGPYAYGLSGYSNVLDEFGGGDGVIGIHGTNEPEVIGTDVSHGCIRLTNEAISQLAPVLPLGTPVSIEA